LRVLHVWNTAGIGSIIAKYQKMLLGWDTWVIMRKEWDKFGMTTYGELLDVSGKRFILKALFMARKYDVIHVHALDKIVPLLKLLYPRKTIILHYHGSNIRGKWNSRKKYWRWADLLLISTPDLLEGAPKHAIYLPNPVDTELFKPMPELRKTNTGLYIIKHQRGENIEWARRIAEKLSIKLTIVDRDVNPIPYMELPRFLNHFEYYIDRNYIPSLSKTALEALACGLKVVRWDDKVIENLPPEHKPENVIYKLKEIIEKNT